MPAPRKRSRPPKYADPTPDDRSELVQVRVSKKARDLLHVKARGQVLTLAAYVRRLLYRDIGLIQKDSSDAT